MSKLLIAAVVLFLPICVKAGPPEILLEACNLFEAAPKRMECLRAATQMDQQSHVSAPSSLPASPATPRAAYSAPPAAKAVISTPRPTPSGGATCYVGPRGGTYTLTASGRKNYGGC
jgi:hypothetical protein